jgi:Flp pilus assembly protein TadD
MVETVVEKETYESEDFFMRAKENIKRGNYSGGKEYLKRAVKIAPDNPFYLSFLGVCTAMEGDRVKGMSQCADALKSLSSESILYVNLGRVLLEDGRKNEARSMFLKGYWMDRTNAPAALELSGMGIRRMPVIPFLSRNSQVNIFLGKLRHRILNRKK